ncbi:RGS domain-containing protein [Tuber brumale]|nr:RGS domain-containing protein [Tuber brumale]
MGTMSERNRLPTLFEVLSRRTLPPVDLFSFYIYMRDQQRSVDYLDFWLDVAQHISLCRHYVRELRRSVLVSTPDLDKGSKRSSGAPEELLGDENYEQKSEDRLSAFLRSEGTSDTPVRRSVGDTLETPGTGRPSFMSSSALDPNTDSTSPGHTVTRNDLRASAEKILYTFLLRGAEREIVLPEAILQSIANAIEVEARDDPAIFDEAKDYVFQAMERDAFPGFLRAKALGNLVPPSATLRLIIGLLAMFGGFWAAFALIFLDIKPKSTRLWLILPFSIGIYCLMAHQYSLDPIMGLIGISEYTLLSFTRVKEPFVRRLLSKRSLWILMLTILMVAALTCLYVFVPGKRL